MQQLTNYADNEAARLNALRDLRLLDTPPSEAYDRLTRLASRLLSAPVSTISLTDGDRQWFKSRVGVEMSEIPREQAPCSYAIDGEGVFVVRDLLEDPRFADSPLAQAGIRFYAGAPLFTRAGYGLGTLCVVDTVPRDIEEDEARVLTDLAGMVMSQVELQNMIGRIDPTTGAANQHQMFEDLDDLASQMPGMPISALIFELMSDERAADLNRALGTVQSEKITQRAMSLLQQLAGNAARIYHVGPLRCVALFEEPHEKRVPDFIEAAFKALAEPLQCDGVPVSLDPSVGTYDFAIGAVAPRDVLRRLTIAAGEAQLDANAHASYLDIHEELGARRFRLVNDFAAALESDDQLSLAFQPRIDMKSGAWVSVEALLRWSHPDLGNVSPGEFIPLIEKTALARPLMEWVARAAFAQQRAWSAKGLDLKVSINAVALNLDEPDFAERLIATAEEFGVATSDVELEFTESAVSRDPETVVKQMKLLRQAGMSLAIDDFGTGYSNLSYLQQLPVSILKIDQSFVRHLDASPKDQKLVRAVIRIAHDLGYRVVAEGIETSAAYDMLRDWGCDEGQGYLMSRPVAPEIIAREQGAIARVA
jgi:EAL domain-containing protein (putative c-di-GMP-specific phosphodiesterase class I)/GGDEF domain-containing protein